MSDVVLTEKRGKVGIITVNRPEALNAVNQAVREGLAKAAAQFDTDEDIGCIVITGAGDRAFIAGADIKEMSDKSYMDMYMADSISLLDRMAETRSAAAARSR